MCKGKLQASNECRNKFCISCLSYFNISKDIFPFSFMFSSFRTVQPLHELARLQSEASKSGFSKVCSRHTFKRSTPLCILSLFFHWKTKVRYSDHKYFLK